MATTATKRRYICVRVSDGFNGILKDEAAKAGVSRSRLVRIVLAEDLRRRIYRRRFVEKHLGPSRGRRANGSSTSRGGSLDTLRIVSPPKESKP